MEVDQYGSAKKSASRPKMQRIQPDHLTDRELLVLGILSTWRARWTFFFAALPDNEIKVWTGLPMRIFESSLDIATKISAVSTSLGEYEAAFRLEPSDPKYELFVGWMKSSLSVVFVPASFCTLILRQDFKCLPASPSICYIHEWMLIVSDCGLVSYCAFWSFLHGKPM